MNFLQKLKTDRSLLLAFLALGLVALLLTLLAPADTTKPEAAAASAAEEAFDVDTFIPAGHLLIPLQLSNAESLASLSGPFSLVDLYATRENGRKSFKVASAVKLLRAPLNPQQFAVLVREDESAPLVTMEGPFFAALKNPKDIPPTRDTTKKSAKRPLLIHYGDEHE